jgi:hypothetical protein
MTCLWRYQPGVCLVIVTLLTGMSGHLRTVAVAGHSDPRRTAHDPTAVGRLTAWAASPAHTPESSLGRRHDANPSAARGNASSDVSGAWGASGLLTGCSVVALGITALALVVRTLSL